MADRMPWDNRKLPVRAQRVLAAAGVDLADERVASYVKNRNDYSEPNYNHGREAVDKALSEQAEALRAAADTIGEHIRRVAWEAEKSTSGYRFERVSHADAAEALVSLSGALGTLQHRVETLAAALGVRAEDDEADAALHRFSDALSGRRSTPTEG